MDAPRPLSRRAAELLGWSAVAGVGSVMLTQAFGYQHSKLVASAQALTPYGIPLVAAVATTALWRRSHALALASATVGLAALALAAPIALPASRPIARAAGSQVTATTVNLLYSNPSVGEVADVLGRRDTDIIVFSEYTEGHAHTLLDHPLSARYPHRIDRPSDHAHGLAVWSKFPLDESDDGDSLRAIVTTVATPTGPLELFGVHPPTPLHDNARWNDELRLLGERAGASEHPTLLIGDFNASYWHPAFRELLRQGLTDAHIAAGRGWSPSWPTDELVPPFVRLDHALTGNGLMSTRVDDFDVPGSDHTAFVVTVSPVAD